MFVLDQLGLAEKLIEKTTIIEDFYFRNEKNEIITSYKTNNYEKPSVSCERSTIYEILTQEMNEKEIEIKYDKKLIEIKNEKNKTTLCFEDGTIEECDIVVGADGANSVVRKTILKDGPNPSYVGIIGIHYY
jgi:2-polyprenyl-6-methoxyphenol hydroxylase-like FAD-dependent oxidoreductase